MAITQFKVAQVKSGDTTTVDFGSKVINASTAVQGYQVAYSNDHHVLSLEVSTSLKGISGSSVSVGATCKMRDGSNHEGIGTVTVLVIAVTDS